MTKPEVQTMINEEGYEATFLQLVTRTVELSNTITEARQAIETAEAELEIANQDVGHFVQIAQDDDVLTPVQFPDTDKFQVQVSDDNGDPVQYEVSIPTTGVFRTPVLREVTPATFPQFVPQEE